MKKICWIFLISFSIGYNIIFLTPIIHRHNQHFFGRIYSLLFKSKEIEPKVDINFNKLSLDLQTYLSNSSDILREKLFPWLYHIKNNLSLYYGEKNSKGIVICVGNQYFGEIRMAIKALQILENELPIEVMYSTSNDLSLDNQKTFNKTFPHIPLIDLSLTSFNDSFIKLRGWEIKPFAILASKFEKVILMDADVLFFEKPSILFENKYFIQTGTLFFYDRLNLTNRARQWIKTFSLNNKQSLPIRTQESGVVLIDKSRVLYGLLSICKLNDYQQRKYATYKYLYGDKDTFWLGMHMVNMPYSFMPTMTASIGRKVEKNKKIMICGQLLHFDENNTLIWWNGGMLKDRHLVTKSVRQIDGWLEEGYWKEWRISSDWCIMNNKQTPRQFNERQLKLINEYRRITKEVFNVS